MKWVFQNRPSKWLMTLAAFCHLKWCQMENCVGPLPVWQVSILVMGYVHSNSKPSVTNVQTPPWPTHRWWVHRLALLTISYHSPHWCFRNCEINLPNKVQRSPYAWMDLIQLKTCLLGNTAHTLLGYRCLPDEINPSLWYSCQTICLFMIWPHQDCIHR